MIDYSEVEEGKVTGQQHLALRIITNLLKEAARMPFCIRGIQRSEGRIHGP